MAITYLSGKRIQGLSSDTKPADVPDGSQFEETNTYKIFQRADSWITTAGNLSGGVYHPSGKGDATDGWNTTGISPTRNELDIWNGTTWADSGHDCDIAVSGASGVGTSASITLAGGDYASEDSGAACSHYDGTSWTQQANMDTGKSRSAAMGTPSSYLSCGGEIVGGSRSGEVQEYDLSGDSWSSGVTMPTGGSIDGVMACAGDGTSTSNGMCVGGTSTDNTITASSNAFNGTNWTTVSVPDLGWAIYSGLGGGTPSGFWVMGGDLAGGYGTGEGAVGYYNGTSWETKSNCLLSEAGAGGANNGGTNPQIGGGNIIGGSGNGSWTSGQYWGGTWVERGT